jgi:putative cardiolipin synthase
MVSVAVRLFVFSSLLLLTACASHRPADRPPVQFSVPAAADGLIAEFSEIGMTGAEPNESAFWFLWSSSGAFEARVGLFDAAVESVDVQYFIWQDDLTSWFLLQRLLSAADRGVRVRLLVDDVSGSARDRQFFALSQHANIEVRTFNVFRARSPVTQAPEFLLRIGTLNHRMHNKTIVADGHVGIIGGRNIGDRYFGVYEKFIQHDLDIMFAGPIVEAAQRNFDDYWNSSYSVVVQDYLRQLRRVSMDLEELRAYLAEFIRGQSEILSGFSLASSQWLHNNAGHAVCAPARYIYDTPNINDAAQERIKDELHDFLDSAREEIVIVSAYFIPDEQLLTLLERARSRGVRVVVLTNSVQSNNHTLAHVSYKRFRRRLLRADIELYELRPDAALLNEQSVGSVRPGYLGLHAKAAVVDGNMVMVGTASFDPRALDINTESAVLLENEVLANDLRAQILIATTPQNAWRVSLDDRGREFWQNDSEVRHSEPARGPWQRIKQFLSTLLPIKDQA